MTSKVKDKITFEKISGDNFTDEIKLQRVIDSADRPNTLLFCVESRNAGTAKYKIYSVNYPQNYQIITLNVMEKSPIRSEYINKIPLSIEPPNGKLILHDFYTDVIYGNKMPVSLKIGCLFDCVKTEYIHTIPLIIKIYNSDKKLLTSINTTISCPISTEQNLGWWNFVEVPNTKDKTYLIKIEQDFSNKNEIDL